LKSREELMAVTRYRHDEMLVPEDGVLVEVVPWVEGQVVLLLPVTFSVHEHVGLDDDGLSAGIAQKLEIYFIVPV